MIRKVRISNFKSVQELELELGRLNVFIGENGCGKTSILEGIAMGSAAAQDKLDEEFLVSRGVRVVEPVLMKSAFSKESSVLPISIAIDTAQGEDSFHFFKLTSGNSLESAWKIEVGISNKLASEFQNKFHHTLASAIEREEKARAQLTQVQQHKNEFPNADVDSLINNYEKLIGEIANTASESRSHIDEIARRKQSMSEFDGFLLYLPENHFLRRFEEEGQIRPLGIRGEGLFRHLVELSKEEPETFKAIADQLSLIDWYEGLSIPTDLSFTERRISIRDRFIEDTIKDFDQRSANEGFLYLLFYFTLFISKYTPGFFAIDNIDNALNPKLCAKLVSVLAKLSAEHNKQAILTTHNPAVLDGLDLNDDEQRLFVIYRNDDGETAARRVMPPKPVEGVEPVRLSEAFVRGYLGGLPQNF